MKSARIFSDVFNRIVDATKEFTAPRGVVRKETTYIRLDFNAEENRVTGMAVDGYRLSVEHGVIDQCDESFSVYIRGTVKLPKKQWATISVDDETNEVMIRCDEVLFGYVQPQIDRPFAYEKSIPAGDPAFRIGFNGEYMLTALRAAKVSCGSCFKEPVVLEFRSPLEPIVLRTNKDDIKMVLPVRIREGESK